MQNVYALIFVEQIFVKMKAENSNINHLRQNVKTNFLSENVMA